MSALALQHFPFSKVLQNDDDFKAAIRRHKNAFGITPRIRLRDTSKDSRLKFNRKVAKSIPLLITPRERIENNLIEVVTEAMETRLREIADDIPMNELADDASKLYFAIRRPGDSDEEVQRAIRARVAKSANAFNAQLELTLRRALGKTAFRFDSSLVIMDMILLAESGARFINKLVETNQREAVKAFYVIEMEKAANKRSKEDEYLLQLTIGGSEAAVLPASSQMSELLDAIVARANKITLNGFSKQMFETLRQTLKDELYFAQQGGAGARELSRRIGRDLLDAFKTKLPEISKDRLMLWARTEGAVTQNDALMKRGKDLGMNGKIWQTVGDDRVRQAHSDNEGDGVIPADERFSDGSTDGGSGSKSPYNCFHPSQIVSGDYLSASRVLYSGEMLSIQTRKGHRVICTPNHPILTDEGFKRARFIQNGDNLFDSKSAIFRDRFSFTRQHDEDDEQLPIEKVFQSFLETLHLWRRDVAPLDFYDDGQSCAGKIDVVFSESALRRQFNSALDKHPLDQSFTVSAQSSVRSTHLLSDKRGILPYVIPLNPFLFGRGARSYAGLAQSSIHNVPAASELLRNGVNAQVCSIQRSDLLARDLCVAESRTYGNPVFSEDAVDDAFIAAQFVAQLDSRFPGAITLDDVISIDHFDYSGFVYDLESEDGLMLADGVICKQCRCAVGPALLNPRPK